MSAAEEPLEPGSLRDMLREAVVPGDLRSLLRDAADKGLATLDETYREAMASLKASGEEAVDSFSRNATLHLRFMERVLRGEVSQEVMHMTHDRLVLAGEAAARAIFEAKARESAELVGRGLERMGDIVITVATLALTTAIRRA